MSVADCREGDPDTFQIPGNAKPRGITGNAKWGGGNTLTPTPRVPGLGPGPVGVTDNDVTEPTMMLPTTPRGVTDKA